MSKILISPYAARLFDGRESPKRYPYWPKLVDLLNKEGYEVVQVGVKGEDRIDGVSQFVIDFPFHKLKELLDECVLYIAVDNVFQHFAHYERLKRGIVLWGPSDYKIFGHPENINMSRGMEFLRPNQFQTWTEWEWNPAAFPYAENVLHEVVKLTPPALTARTSIGSYATTRT